MELILSWIALWALWSADEFGFIGLYSVDTTLLLYRTDFKLVDNFFSSKYEKVFQFPEYICIVCPALETLKIQSWDNLSSI